MIEQPKINPLSKSLDQLEPLKEYSILTNFPKKKNININKDVLHCIPNEVILQSKIYYIINSYFTNPTNH